MILAPDLVLTDRGFEANLAVTIGSNGSIASVGAADGNGERLRGALLPGFVNAHSHAFQRGLRGRGETFPDGTGSFWTWREAMYGLVEALDEESLFQTSLLAFREMLRCGITAVGEFHYLHHLEPSDWKLDRIVLRAAEAAGLRIVLLNAFYRNGGFGRPLQPNQRRFGCDTVERYFANLDALAHSQAINQHLGVVAHSLRAVPLEDVAALRNGCRERDLPFHLHIEEQRQEIEDCIAYYGDTPMGVLLKEFEDFRDVTAVHCTHTRSDELQEFVRRGGRVCLCPLTEANLGDGLPEAPLGEIGGLCLGTDSNNRIDMFEEMRWLEYGQRLGTESRGRLTQGRGETALRLLRHATGDGAQSLGLATGSIEPGRPADLQLVNLDHPLLADVAVDNIAAALVFGCDGRVVDAVWVGGKRLRL